MWLSEHIEGDGAIIFKHACNVLLNIGKINRVLGYRSK